jgi:hypothetical protein
MSRAESVRRTSSRMLVTAAAVLLAAVFAFGGQERNDSTSPVRWEFGLTGGAAFPMGAFKNNLGSIGWSIDGFLGHRIGRSPLTYGFDFYFMNYGDRTHDENLSGTIPLEVQVETSNNLIQGLLYLKCQPSHGRVRPYLEALAGGSYLYTQTSISGTEYPYDEIASSTNFDDFTFCAGGGAGMTIHLGGGRRTAGGSRSTEIWLDIKARYLYGGRAQYLRPDSIVYDSDRGEFTYLYRESKTNLLSAQVGVAFTF